MTQRTLTDFVAPEFDRLTTSVQVLLRQRPKDFKPDSNQAGIRVFVSGEFYGQAIRSLGIHKSDWDNWQQFAAIASNAGQCLGPWCLDFAIAPESLHSKNPTARWLFALFDLAWAGEIPSPARKGAIDIRRVMRGLPSEAFDSKIANVVVASRIACKVLKGKAPKGKRRKPRPKASPSKTTGKQQLLISGLTGHHRLKDGSVNYEPIGSNKLAEKVGVAGSTASKFFNEKFGGPKEYRAQCADGAKLDNALKLLNDEVTPRVFNLQLRDANQIADDN